MSDINTTLHPENDSTVNLYPNIKADNIPDAGVSPVKTSFFGTANLYDNKTITNTALNNSGSAYSVTGAYCSSFIEATSKKYLYVSGSLRVAYYTSSSVSAFSSIKILYGNATALIIPDTVNYIRFDIGADYISSGYCILADSEIKYIDSSYLLKIDSIGTNDLMNKIQVILDDDNLTISYSNTDFFNIAENLYDNTSITNTALNTSGTTYSLSGAYTSGYLAVEGFDYVYTYLMKYCAFYDADKTKLSVFDGTNFQKKDIPDDAVYFRYSCLPSNISASKVFMLDFEINSLDPNPFIKPEYIQDSVSNFKINCYGDSLTEGAGSTSASTYSYPSRLKSLIIENNPDDLIEVNNYGVGGEDSARISMRSGAYNDMVNPFTIPADTTAVSITKSGNIGLPISGNTTIKNGVNPVTISGIEGTLSYNSGYYFTRSEEGTETEVERPVQLLTASSQNSDKSLLIIEMGTNDTRTAEGYTALLINRIQQMIKHCECSEYIIIGLTKGDDIDDINTSLYNTFGSNFINLKTYLMNYGLADNSITPTEQDLEDIANNLIPTSLRSDATHFNNYGYYSFAKCVYLKGIDLGYWK